MTETILTKLIFAGIIFWLVVIIIFLVWRVLDLMKRIKQVQADREWLLEERTKQSNKLRLKEIEEGQP